MSEPEPVTLYIDADDAQVRVDGRALRIARSGNAAQWVPLSRIARASVTGSGDGLLRACLAIAANGGSIHFRQRDGSRMAVLQPAIPSETDAAQELADLVSHHDGLVPFQWWRDAQRRHAWSLIFRRGYAGDFEANKQRLLRYLRVYAPHVPTATECEVLTDQLHAWVQHELLRQGLQPVVRALSERGADLPTVLRDCLMLSLVWRYVTWRRQQPRGIERVELIRLFERHAAASLPSQFNRHIRALASEYRAAQPIATYRDQEATDALD